MSERDQTAYSGGAATTLTWLAAALTLLPSILYAYLGHFSRLMIDDYGHFATALGISFRHNFAFWRNLWNGSYSFYVFHDLLSPLDPARLPPLFLGLTMTLWLIGLTWLISLLLRHMQITPCHLPVAIALAALTVFASIKSFHTLESIYWYSANVRHTFPVGIMLLFLGFALDIAKRLRTNIHLLAAAMAGALICFVSGGFSELNVALQLVFWPILSGLLILHTSQPRRRAQVAVLAAGWCGSIVSAIVFLSAPGVANRMETAANKATNVQVIRDLPALVMETLRSSIEYIGHQGSILGFTLLLAAGLVTALLIRQPMDVDRSARSLKLPARLLLTGLAVQLAFLPTLWTDLGELAFYAGNELYMSVGIALLNTAMLGTYPIIIVFRRQIESSLAQRIEYLMPMSTAIIVAVVALLVMTQPTGLHYRISLYLFANAFVLLAILAQILDSVVGDGRSRQLAFFALSSLALCGMALALTLAIGHFGVGFIFVRSLTFAALTQVLPGLAFGAYIGFLIQRCRPIAGANARFFITLIALGLLIVVGIVIADMTAQARLIPDFATFAREWDARHEHIIRMRENGARDIEIKPFSFDLSGYISASGQAFGESHPYYYGVDSITVVE